MMTFSSTKIKLGYIAKTLVIYKAKVLTEYYFWSKTINNKF